MKVYTSFVALGIVLSLSNLSADPEKARVHVVVYDIGADRPVARTAVEFVVYSDCSSGPEILRSSAFTDDSGEFEALLPIGQHLVGFSAPLHRPVRACVDIASSRESERCGSRSLQSLLVRTVSDHLPLPGDILNRHPCRPYLPSVCEALNLPRKVYARSVVFVNEQNRPIANLALEFRQNSMARGKLWGSVTTDSEGEADLSAIYALAHGHLAQVGTNKSGAFLLEFSPMPTTQSQRIRIMKWQCQGHQRLQATSD